MHDGVVSTETMDGLTLVTLAGELDVAVAGALHRELTRAVTAARPGLAIDLRQVTFLDCAAVGAIIASYKRVTAHGGCLRLVGADNHALRILELCRLDNVWCFHDSVELATAAECSRHAPRADPTARRPEGPPQRRVDAGRLPT